jgi:hypothetical protein
MLLLGVDQAAAAYESAASLELQFLSVELMLLIITSLPYGYLGESLEHKTSVQ